MIQSKMMMTSRRRVLVEVTASCGVFVALGTARRGWAASLKIPTDRLIITDQIMTDPLSGLAIHGFDPVAYFVDQKAQPGRQQFEFVWSGVAWRFASESNRSAFMASPETFAPAYGGYDAEAISRGKATAASPTLFLVEADRLFLFRSPEAREAFVNQKLRDQADKAWPDVLRELKP